METPERPKKGRGSMNGKLTNKGQGFQNRPENINRKGAPRAVRKTITETIRAILESDTGEIRISADRVAKVHDDGSVSIKMPTSDALVQKFISLAFSKDERTALGAIEKLIDRVEGRPKQAIEVTQKEEPTLPEWMNDEE